jgi:hypothetical protein
MLERRETAGLGVEIGKVEAPTVLLAAAMLANDSIEPTLEASRQREILTIDRQNERIVESAAVEPVRQDQLDPKRPAVRVRCFFPFVDPREAMPASFRQLPDRGRDRGRLEAVEARLETLVVACADPTPDEGQDLIWRDAIRREVLRPASRALTICEAAQIRTSASQMVAMPCSDAATTRIETAPARKSIGSRRFDFASEKNG